MEVLKRSKKIQKLVNMLLLMKEQQPGKYKVIEFITDGMILGSIVLVSMGIAIYAAYAGYTNIDSALVGVAMFDINIAAIFLIRDDLQEKAIEKGEAINKKRKQKKESRKETTDIVRTAYEKISRDDSAEYMAELLMDDKMSTYKMYEDLATLYMEAEDTGIKKGIDQACTVLTGYCMRSISEQLLHKYSTEIA